jgi:hypothetical protein
MFRQAVPHIGAFRTPTTSTTIRAIDALQQRMFRLTAQSGLSNTPWSAPNNTELPLTKPTVFLYDRQGAGRRVLANSEAIKRDLETRFHATVALWGEKKWNKSVTQSVAKQAEIYNSQRYIVAPHGAHLANIFFARP